LPGIAIAPVQYPGRETRIDEPRQTDLDCLINDLATALIPHLDQPYALLGYSLGAKVSFALAHQLQAAGLPLPQSLHVVAHRAPDAAAPHPGAANLPEAEFCHHVKSYGGTPEEVFSTPELAELLLPILRTDFALVEQLVPLTPLACPIYAYAGNEDPIATPTSMLRWKLFSSVSFALRPFPGGHFFTRTTNTFFSTLAKDMEMSRSAPIMAV
jgi:surfactin synthase thioesterase subunit